MTRKLVLGAIAIGVACGAVISLVEPVLAGTCQPVTAIGRSPKLDTATSKAQTRFKQKAAKVGGKVTQKTTNCEKGVTAYSCKIKAVVCP